MNVLFQIFKVAKQRAPKFVLEGNSDKGQPNPIDTFRNKLRSNEITKYVIEHGYLLTGQPFGFTKFDNSQQVVALMRKLKVIIRDYVTEQFNSELQYNQVLQRQNYLTAQKYPQFFDFDKNENDEYATVKPMTEQLFDELRELVIDQLIQQFNSILKSKVVK